MIRIFKTPGVALGLAALLLSLTSAASAQDGPTIDVQWRSTKFSNRLWIVDRLARGDAAYLKVWTKAYPLSPQDRKHLKRYLELYDMVAKGSNDRPSAPVLLTPEPDAGQRFLVAGLAASTSRDFANRLRLKPIEGQALDKVFANFRARLNKFIDKAEYLPIAHQQFESQGDKVKLKSFLGRVAEFFGVRGRVQGPLTIDIVFSPGGVKLKAHQIGSHIVFPCAPVFASSKEQPKGMGAIVHEACHFLISRLGRKSRSALEGKLLARLGSINPSHPNVFEEATCTALGNIVFMREAYSREPLPSVFHAYEPGAEHPHAIDSLARRLEFPAGRGLGRAKAFEGNYLTQALATQARLLPARPRHFSRFAKVFWEDVSFAEPFEGMFGDHYLTDFEGEKGVSLILADAARDHTAARWFVVTLKGLVAHPALGRELGNFKAKITKGLGDKDKKIPACVVARRRSNGALDVFVIGADASGVREGLIFAHGLETLPLEAPVFVPEQ